MKKITLMNGFMVMGLAMAIAFAPVGAFAKDGKDDKNENKNSCFRAYGHLIAPGWIKMKGDLELKGRCWFPFGIGKKFKTNPPVVADVKAPVISDIKTEVDYTDAVVKFETDERADAVVFYGTTAGLDLNNSATLRVENKDMRKEHRAVLSNLSANTKYYVVIRSKDFSGNVATSAELNFTTKAPVVAGDTTSPVISSVVALSALNSVSVGWVTNEPATTKVFYSTGSLANLSASGVLSIESNELKTRHLIIVPNLSLNTDYHMIIQSRDAAGNLQSTTEFTARAGI